MIFVVYTLLGLIVVVLFISLFLLMHTQKKALVTGILGQDGPYLAKLLLEKGYKVYGMIRRYSNPHFANLEYLGIKNRIEYVQGDLTDEASLYSIIKSVRPDEVYNLAAQSFVGGSWDMAKFTTEVNAVGVLYLLNAIKAYSPMTKFYQATTSEVYGNNHDNGWRSENTAFHPRSPYGVSKLYAHWITVNYRESYNLYACSGILFNHESPIRGIQFVSRKVTDRVAQIKLGLAEKLDLGYIDAKRDWGFAGDYVEGMYLMLQQEKPDDYVLATGKTHSVRDLVSAAFSYVGIADWDKYLVIDPRNLRPAEVFELRGDASKAKEKLGWEPKTSFTDLVKMMVDADIARYEAKIKSG